MGLRGAGAAAGGRAPTLAPDELLVGGLDREEPRQGLSPAASGWFALASRRYARLTSSIERAPGEAERAVRILVVAIVSA